MKYEYLGKIKTSNYELNDIVEQALDNRNILDYETKQVINKNGVNNKTVIKVWRKHEGAIE